MTMTKHEAIRCLKKQIEIQPCGNVGLALEMAIKALETSEDILDWQAAVNRVMELNEMSFSITEVMYYHDLLIRYAVGERTKELYELMIKAH